MSDVRTTNILIGVGGTGAKIVEAAVMLFAAGLGPATVHVALVDQDSSNGNVNRTQTAISDLVNFRRLWGNRGQNSAIDWSGGPSGTERPDFGAVNVVELFEGRSLWYPGGDQTSLNTIIGRDLSERQRDLYDLLFMQGGEEQDLQLGEGYRGRAHVGAAALIASLVERKSELIDRLGELMSGKGDRGRVNIFIAGSAFGGTGASGFPTLARELNRRRNEPRFDNPGKVWIGGALMLPYFSFTRPQENAKPVVTTSELLPKAQLALEYYEKLFGHERPFDRFYALGWNSFFPLDYHSAGNKEQRNPPLVPELLAASAVLDFFAAYGAEEPPAPLDRPAVMVGARAGNGIRWSDLPHGDEIQAKFGQALRFAAYWLHIVEPLLLQRNWRGAPKGTWAQNLAGSIKVDENDAALASLRAVLLDLLNWAAAIEKTAGPIWGGAGPWATAALLDHGHMATPTEPVRVATKIGDEALDAVTGLVRSANGEPLTHDAAAMWAMLRRDGDRLAAGGHKGFGRTLAAVHAAARTR